MKILTTFAAAAVVAACASVPAIAGPAEDMAKARIASIASGDLDAVAAGYADGAQLHWVGGPLDGTYTTPEQIGGIWQKFTSAQGEQTAEIAMTSEAANPAGATVTADVVFKGKNAVPVRYVLVYRGDKVADEIWQVNPAQ
ncbi:nuclear transport factor 2 family protein [Paracoccus laeviglucosivorans]|uniref:SnoaL-like domain-containing protein n=1 Tax=Paracoccus laeviglucosivorans TaxID=1197861 RepID=A0A521FNI8_9RHOB|nr:nuclear transport factor 2 family protein [Paracoccus laeviglucosivorans]SMO97130.1 hypothetical protein SAMN06265221_1271 [Paracoccus laeviglucosivorans]